MRHTVELLMKNKTTALSRVLGLYTRRGLEIDQLTFNEMENPELSHMSITMKCDPSVLDQMVKLLDKQIDVLQVQKV
ncbi:acetolactate synthase small subunit [Thermoflavimicrobium daqui]|jgi:acetolactate synthase-1/3 small subunit|uniref:Acetolactate synthase small subunit n=1 Tax=Thermoflavimicrobium daqui TaxID=2137476 RepID=A0A364K6Y7_9BACL|nr:acetolactate synthase small subunit [Thermoflavimicrobium daqui]RAL26065.1 acetolactate synthase small subunit [Thermoflavimicrobium daqui]